VGRAEWRKRNRRFLLGGAGVILLAAVALFLPRRPPRTEAEARQRELLDRTFAGHRAFVVTHPYPVDLAGLLEAVRPVLASA